MDYQGLFNQIEEFEDYDDSNIKDNFTYFYQDDENNDDSYIDNDIDDYVKVLKMEMMLSKTFKKIIFYIGKTYDDYDTILEKINNITKDSEIIDVDLTQGNIGYISNSIYVFKVYNDEVLQKLVLNLRYNRSSNVLNIEFMVNGKLFIRSIRSNDYNDEE